MSLNRQFTDFLNALPGLESLDRPGVFPNGYSGARADYAFDSRNVIVEKKFLQRDVTARVQKIVEEYHGRPGFPPVYGEQPLTSILAAASPELREEVHGRVLARVTATLSRAFEKANDQIAATKDVLKKPAAGGLLIVINDDAPLLAPNIFVYEIQRLLKRATHSGQSHYADIHWVIVISSAHQIRTPDGTLAHPFLMMQGRPSAVSDRVAALVELIKTQWAVYDNARMIEGFAGRGD